MATKKDVSNAYYEGMCLAISCLGRDSEEYAVTQLMNHVDNAELGEFLMTSDGEFYRQFFPLENGQLIKNRNKG